MQLQPATVTLIFTAVTAFGVLLQALILFGIFLASRKAMRRVETLSDELKTHVVPVLVSTRNLLEDVSPRIKEAVGNLTLATEELRSQAENINSTLGSIVDKTRVQADRVDGMVSDALDGVNHAVHTVQQTVAVPLRQFTGVLNGLRAGLDALLSRDRKSHVPEDKDLFV